MLQQLPNAVCVEDMPAFQLDARLLRKFACVADTAHVRLGGHAAVLADALGLEARQALGLAFDAEALMAALLHLSAEVKCRGVFNLDWYILDPLALL